MANKIWLFSALLISFAAQAALPPNTGDIDSATLALRLPPENRLQALKAQPKQSLNSLIKLVDDEQQSLQIRWRALTAMAQLDIDKAMPHIERSLISKQWFMRNAGLICLKLADRAKAIKWAEKLLRDKALVVRTAAVQVLDHFRATESQELLWSQLHAKENYHNGQGLWIRKYIAAALAKMAHPGQEGRYIRLLQESDLQTHPAALAALERITGEPLSRSEWLSKSL